MCVTVALAAMKLHIPVGYLFISPFIVSEQEI